MSVTNLQIIEDALREINVISEVDSASDEQGSQALRRLNQMMASWKEQSLDIGYFRQTTTTDTCPIPDYAEEAVMLSLAASLAPRYGASLSVESAVILDQRLAELRQKAMRDLLDNTDMTHMPYGMGHYDRYDITSDQ